MSRLYAIGDLHGHARELYGLIDKLVADGMEATKDTIVFLGDYVDSGPATKELLNTIIGWRYAYPHWVFLLGNHDQMLVDAYDNPEDATIFLNWYRQGGRETHLSYDPDTSVPMVPFATYSRLRVAGSIRADHVHFLTTLPLYHETDRHIFVHAGLRPPLPPQLCDRRDMLWIRDDFIRSGHDWGKVVVYGHTPTVEPLVMFNKIGINTLPRHTGKLTAVELTDGLLEPRFTFQEVLG